MNKQLFNQKHLTHYDGLVLIEALATRSKHARDKLPTSYGIEHGALAWPTILSDKHFVSYFDYRNTETSQKFYGDKLPPADQSSGLVVPNIVGEMDILLDLNLELDFYIASHVFEHLPDPIKFLRIISKILKPGGRLMLTVPDAKCIYDKNRPRTTITDLICAGASSDIYYAKILEYIVEVEKIKDPLIAENRKKEILILKDDPHLWTFDTSTYAPLLEEIAECCSIPFKVVSTHYNKPFEEIIAFLERN